jgi:Spy/CpxP family protein refolding chaperone
MSKRLFVMPLILITIILGSSLLASAQQQPPPPKQPLDGDRQQMQPRAPRPPGDPLAEDMFSLDMIMQHQRELALTDKQKDFMRGEMQRTTTRFTELQWELQDAMETLHETMKGNKVNEQLALSQLNKVLDAEREIKTLHMAMSIRIKNQLTADQQMKLQTMRNPFPSDGQRGDRRPGGPGPDGPGRPRPGGPDGMRPGGPGPGGPGGPPMGPGGPGDGGRRPGGPRF